MKPLQHDENDLVGEWVNDEHGRVVADATAARIDWLISTILHKLADSPKWGAWETLFRDPSDGRLWERTYPKGDMQGGGPPRLTQVSAEQARSKYGDLPDTKV